MVPFGKAVSKKNFSYQPIRNKNCPWQPYLQSDRDEMRKLYKGLPQMVPVTYGSIWPSGYRDKMRKLHKGPYIDASCHVWFHLALQIHRKRIFKYQPIRNKDCSWRPYLLSDQDKMRILCKGLPKDASCQVWFHLAKKFQRKIIFSYQPIRNKNCPWQPYLQSDRDKMRKFHIGPAIHASSIVWFHLAPQFQRRRVLKYRPIRNKNCQWRPYLLSDQDEMRKLCKGLLTDASCPVWFHFAKIFPRRRIFLYQPIRNKNCPRQPYLQSNRDEMRKLCKIPPIDASCKVWFHLAKRFQRRRFLTTWPIRIKNRPWRPCQLSDWNEMSKLRKGPYTDASCQVWFHLAQPFEKRRLKCEKLTDGRRQLRRWTVNGRFMVAIAHLR